MTAIEIFRLFGRILVDNEDANRKIEDTDRKAEGLGSRLLSVAGTAARWGAGLAAAAGLAGTALFGLANRTANVADEIDKASQRAGVNAVALQDMRYAAGQMGVSSDNLDRALERLNQRIGRAEEGNQSYIDTLERLGISQEEIEGGALATEDAFVRVIDTLNQIESPMARAAAAGELFGTRLGRQLLPVIEGGVESFQELRNRAHELGIVLSEESVKAGADFSSAMDDIRQILGGIFLQIGDRLMPVLARWVEWTVEHLPKVSAVFQFIAEVVEIVIRHTSRALEPFFTSVREFLDRSWDFIVNTAGTAWQWITGTTWAEKWRDITSWLTTAYQWAIDIAGGAWEWITGTTWAEKLEDIKSWISSAWQWTIDTTGKAWGWLDERFPWLTSALETLWGWLGEAWAWAIDVAGEGWEWLDDRFPALTNALETLWGWLGEAWDWTLNFAGEAWEWFRDTAWPWIGETASTVWGWTFTLLGDFGVWLKDVAWPWLTQAASTTWSWTVEMLGAFGVWLKDVAWPWIGETASTVWAWTVEFLGAAGEWLKDVAWPVISAGAQSAWDFTLRLLGDAWDWLRDVAWPRLSEGASSAWDFTVDAAGAAWEWIRTGGWEDTLEAVQDGFSELPETISRYVSEAVQSVHYWLGQRFEAVVGLVINTILRITNFFQALRDGTIRRITTMVTSTLDWFRDLRDSGLAYVEALAEGIQEWWGETKLGKTFNWLEEQLSTTSQWFWELYDKVVGHSYIPDMVEEIGEAIERLKERLANPVARYTAEALGSFETLAEGAIAAATAIADGFDRILGQLGQNIGDWITDVSVAFWHGTATWASIFEGFTSLLGNTFRNVFNMIAVELAKNLLKQNSWLTKTLANIAAAITGYLSQAFATLTAFFAWSGPLAPVLAGGVIAAAIAAIASIGGNVMRSIMPSVSGPSSSGPDTPPGDGMGPSPGRQISEITGPTRDLLTTLLSPIARLDEQTGILGSIHEVLDTRLPHMDEFAAIGGPSVVFEAGAIQVTAGIGADGRRIGAEVLDVIEEGLAERMEDRRRGESR